MIRKYVELVAGCLEIIYFLFMKMASNEKDCSTKEQASQTYKSLEERSTTDQGQVELECSDLSPLDNPSAPVADNSGPDQTHLKTAAEIAQSSSSAHDEEGQPQSQCLTQEDRVGVEGYIQDHQCAHPQSLIGEEHTLHQAKQEEGGQRKGRGSTQRESSFDEEQAYLRSFSNTTDLATGDGSVFSTSLSSSQSSLTLCDTCSAADRALHCSASKEFWRGVESTRLKCCERLWGHILTKLKETFPDDPALKQKRVIHMMKSLLDISDTLETVTMSKYLRLVKFIGPFRSEGDRCVILQQLEDLLAKSNLKDPKNKKKRLCWFAGPMNRDVAETKLDGKPPGTFLIRMSGTEEEEGNFALSLMMADSTIEHFLLEGHPQEAARSNPFSLCVSFRGRTFASLPDIVNEYLRVEEIADEDCDNGTRCTLICPDLPFNQIINSYAK